jgi:SPOR domain
MSDSRTASGLDRLPWLTDEPAPKKTAPVKRGALDLIGWAFAAILLIAGASFWVGTKSPVTEVPTPVAAPNSTTVPAPKAPSSATPQVRIAPQPEVAPVSVPEVRPAPPRQVRISPPPLRRMATHEARTAGAGVEQKPVSTATETNVTTAQVEAAKPAASAKLTPWPPRVTAGAYGRLVQIGAFGSVQQAKVGWRYMVRTYPAVAHLPAVVRPDRNSKGRVFYRFRIGTTSQAHSEVLCQRMKRIHLSCAVVGLPWKAKIER